ncbi:MAG: O-antigen ligase family protein [Saprospiraceae bacterium]
MHQIPAWLHRAYLLLFALLPWSFEYSFGTWTLDVPAEPLTAVVGIGLILPVMQSMPYWRAGWKHHLPVAAGALWLCWMAVCAACSAIPLVSWKYWFVEAGHWWVFAAGAALFPATWRAGMKLFGLSMAGMVVYTLLHHATYHFRPDQALLAPMPFFPENTLYAAVLAMIVFDAATARDRRRFLLPVFLTGLFFSFSVGAWLSILLAVPVGLVFLFREKWRCFLFAGAAICLALVAFRHVIFEKLAPTWRQSVSVQERLNRYSCAFRMTQVRPWTGFGPGTFQFCYFPYQRTEEMTRISLTEPIAGRSPDTFGRGGGVHSEYWQAMSETGVPGLMLFLVLAASILTTVFRRAWQAERRHDRLLALAFALGLLSFFLHGTANNFLHDGRIAALVWGMAIAAGRKSSENE